MTGELRIDISQQRSKPLEEFAGQDFDFVITVCDSARESLPRLPWEPSEASLALRWSCRNHATRRSPDNRLSGIARPHSRPRHVLSWRRCFTAPMIRRLPP